MSKSIVMLPGRWSPFRVSNIEHPKPGNLCIYQRTDNISLPSIPKLTMSLLSKREDRTERLVTRRSSNVGVSIQDMLVIARSSRENVDLEEVIGMHEFSYMSKVIMAPDGSIHPSDKTP